MSIASVGKAVHSIIEGRIARGEPTGIELVKLSDIKGQALIFDDLPDMDINIEFPKNKVVSAEQYEREMSGHCVMLYQTDGATVWWAPTQNCSIGTDSDFQFSENLTDARGDWVGTYVAVVRDIALTAMDVRNHTVQRDRPAEATKTTPPSPPKDELPWPF